MQITIVLTSPEVVGCGGWLKEAEFAELLELYLELTKHSVYCGFSFAPIIAI